MQSLDSNNNVFRHMLNQYNSPLTPGRSSGGGGALIAMRRSVLVEYKFARRDVRGCSAFVGPGSYHSFLQFELGGEQAFQERCGISFHVSVNKVCLYFEADQSSQCSEDYRRPASHI